MDAPEFAHSPLSLDFSRIGAICEEDWAEFLNDLDVDPIPERQDLRGFLLNWVATFIPEAFPASLSDRLADWMDEYCASAELPWCFVNPPLIGTTLFALTGNPHHLRIQFNNFSNGGSQLRSFLHNSLSLVAPQVEFDDDLIAKLDFGMSVPYFFMDTPLVLYAVSKGDRMEKLANFKKWKEQYRMNPAEAEVVERFLAGRPAPNPLLSWLMRNTAYVSLRLGCYPVASAADASLPLSLPFSLIWSRVEVHPLYSGAVSIARDLPLEA